MTASRSARGWSQLVLEVGLLLVALGLIQVVAERTNRRLDLTAERQLSLAPATRNLLAQVAGPLRITVFHRRGSREEYAGLLGRVQAENPKVTYELFDLDRYPERARSAGVTQYGRALVEYDGRRRVVPALPEEQLAGGILGVVRGQRKRLAFTVGHGERTPGGGERGLGRFVAALDADDLTADAVSLLDGPVPEGTDVVVVAGPEHDFQPVELERLAAHLRGGGGLLLLLDPAPLPNLAGLLASMGIGLGDDVVVDRERRVLGTDGMAAVVEQFRRGNPLSEPDANPIGSGVVLPFARTVDVVREVPGVAAESIARTGESAWAMADAGRASRGEEPTRAAKDVPGPLSVMVLAEIGSQPGNDARRGRLAVIGDADFATDAYLDVLGNKDVALNAVAWLVGEEATAGARAGTVPEVTRPLSPLVLTDAQARRLLGGVVLVLPGLVLLTGAVVVGLRRRWG
ncbi:MAG: GldG family protein [bacterium]|nr:GldG family protein [bacterium]